MGLLSRTLLPIASRATGLEGPLPLTASRVVEWLGGAPTASGLRLSPEGALALSAVWDCVDLVSRDVGRVPLALYQRGADESRVKATNHPLYALLHDSPNPHMTAFTFKQTLQGHKMLRGNAFANIERDRTGAVVALWPLRPDRMDKPVLAQDGRLLYLYHLETGEPRALTQDDVLHIRGLSTDGIWGHSPVQVLRESVGLGVAYREYAARFFSNAARPSGVLEVEKRLTKEAADRLIASWDAAQQGLTNHHRTALLEEGVTWKQMSVTPDEAQFLDSMKYNRIEICSIFHVPPHMIGEMDRATYSNIEEQSLEYEGGTMDAEFANWEQQVNMALLMPGERGPLYTEFNRNALVRATIEKRIDAMVKQWWWTPNEKRALDNMPAIAGFDEPFIPVNNYLPLSKIPNPESLTARQVRQIPGGYRVTDARGTRDVLRTGDGFEVVEVTNG